MTQLTTTSSLIDQSHYFAAGRHTPPVNKEELLLVHGDWELTNLVMQELVDRTAIRTKVKVIFAGGRFSLEMLPLVMGERSYEFEDTVDRIIVSAAETCFQVAQALSNCLGQLEPLVVMDMLEPFYDENLTDKQSDVVLNDCVQFLNSLKGTCPIVISARPHRSRPKLFAKLAELATMTIQVLPEDGPTSTQLNMF